MRDVPCDVEASMALGFAESVDTGVINSDTAGGARGALADGVDVPLVDSDGDGGINGRENTKSLQLDGLR